MTRVAVISPAAPRPEFLNVEPYDFEKVCGGVLDSHDLGGGLVLYWHKASGPRKGQWVEGRYVPGNAVIARVGDETSLVPLTPDDERRILRGVRAA